MDACQVCASHAWAMLPNPHPTQSVTTAGVIVNQPLSKGVCLNCGFTQRDSIEWMAFSQYYENQYENYYNRPGTERYHQARYTAIVDWMSDFIQPQHQKVLDVGCGQGWAMQTFKSKFPNATLHGLEPSHYNSKYARQLGFEVFEGRLADYCDQIEPYDLIFSNNVIQHVDDARAFLRQLKTLLKPEGRLIVTCPNGARPNIEMLWADQNYSFIASHLIALAHQEGYSILSCQESSSSNALPPALMMVLSLKPEEDKVAPVSLTEAEIQALYQRKKEYLMALAGTNQRLLDAVAHQKRVFVFGASYWASVLAGYAPDFWALVSACLIDEGDTDSTFMSKKVLLTQDVEVSNTDAIVLGLNPEVQPAVKDRLSSQKSHCVTWDLALA